MLTLSFNKFQLCSLFAILMTCDLFLEYEISERGEDNQHSVKLLCSAKF